MLFDGNADKVSRVCRRTVAGTWSNSGMYVCRFLSVWKERETAGIRQVHWGCKSLKASNHVPEQSEARRWALGTGRPLVTHLDQDL